MTDELDTLVASDDAQNLFDFVRDCSDFFMTQKSASNYDFHICPAHRDEFARLVENAAEPEEATD